MTNAGRLLINNTGTDIRGFIEAAVWAAIDANPAAPALPDELADLLTLVPVDGYANRWRLEAA